jgi:5-(carboxyamino)imidazole ribonucleotide synthase
VTIAVPGTVIGMLGGGQLGRYAVMSARAMGYGTIVLDPDPAAPAGAAADRHLVAAFDDRVALTEMASSCAVVTTEFENPPAEALAFLAQHVPVRPSPSAIAIAQDRTAEKRFLVDNGFPVGPCAVVDAHVGDEVEQLLPGIVKTARLGYDGRGQIAVSSVDGVRAAVSALGGVACVLERRLDLVTEISVVLARGIDGSVVVWPVGENRHLDGVLDLTVVPTSVPDDLVTAAEDIARRIAMCLDYVGVLAVELFVVDGGAGWELKVNELAPRPHNSGHWTLDASITDQFTQQVRAVTGAALAPTAMTVPAVAMVNLLGDIWQRGEPEWERVLAHGDARLHLYGKAGARPGRKMGHLSVLGSTVDDVAERALRLRRALN